MTSNDNDPVPGDDADAPIVPPMRLPPDAYPPGTSDPSAYPSGPSAPSGYGPPPAGGYPYGSGPQLQPWMTPQPFVDTRPGIGWGILAGAAIIVACAIGVGISIGSFGADIWFLGLLLAFAIVMVAAIALLVPFTTRKIAQGLFIVLAAIPLIWFGVCVQALVGY